LGKVDYVLITSTYYKRDVLNLLFLPEGVQYRFRYREKWVPDEVFQNPSILQNKTVLIVCYFGLQEGEDPSEFFPIRLATLEEVSKLGDILYLRYVTGKIAPSNTTTGTKTLQGFVRDLIGSYLTGRILSKYVVKANDLDVDTQGDQMAAWTSVVMSLGTLKQFQFTNFLKLLGISDQKRDQLMPSNILGSLLRRFLHLKPKSQVLGYQLKSGQSYRVDIMQRIPVEGLLLSSPIEISLQSSDAIVPLGSERIVGSYDKLELNFTVKMTFQDRYSNILLTAAPGKGHTADNKGEVFDIDSPEIFVQCRVRKSLLLTPLVLIGGGIVLTSFSESIASELSSIQILSGSATLVAISLKAVGAALVAIGVGIVGAKA